MPLSNPILEFRKKKLNAARDELLLGLTSVSYVEAEYKEINGIIQSIEDILMRR